VSTLVACHPPAVSKANLAAHLGLEPLQIKGGLFAALLPLFPHGLPVSGKERQTSVKHGNRG